jgi:peptidoglycan/xylan/chitin deacetylase (PgdA/CDA1 family)
MLQKLKYFIRSKLLPNRLFLIDKKNGVKSLYLTFDDGPVPEVTIPLLELLDKYQVKATFFVIGECAKKHPEILRLIHQKGHVLANHTYTHPPFHKISIQQKLKEVIDTNHLIKEVINKDCKMFRAPQGRWDIKLLFQLFRLKITAIHWSRDSMDFLNEEPEKIIERFEIQPVNSGDILLFHDDHVRCITVLDTLIPLWISQGYTLAALEQN